MPPQFFEPRNLELGDPVAPGITKQSYAPVLFFPLAPYAQQDVGFVRFFVFLPDNCTSEVAAAYQQI